MLRAVCEVSIPEVQVGDTTAVAEHLEQMTAQELPAFVIREAGFSLDVVVQRLRPTLEAQHYKMPFDDNGSYSFETKTNVFPVGAELSESEHERVGSVNYDVAFHFDKLPKATTLTHTMHLTTQGEAEVRLFEPTSKFFDTADAREFRINTEVGNALRKGIVDDEYFNPDCHYTVVKPGSLLVFRLGGRVPLVHDFTTIKAPRGAEITDIVLTQPVS